MNYIKRTDHTVETIQKEINELYNHYENQLKICRSKEDYQTITEAFLNDLRILNNEIVISNQNEEKELGA